MQESNFQYILKEENNQTQNSLPKGFIHKIEPR